MTEGGVQAWVRAAFGSAAGVLWVVMAVLGAVLIAVQPTAAEGPASSLALLPLAVCHRIGQRFPVALACPLGAVCGACLDILAQGPVGYWALILAVAAMLGARMRAQDVDGFAAQWALFCVHLLALAALQVGLTAAYTLAAPAWQLIGRQSVTTALLYPLAAWMIAVPRLIPGMPASSRLVGP